MTARAWNDEPPRCAGCGRLIDPLYEAPVADQAGRPWHPNCRIRTVGANDAGDGGAGPLVALVIITFLLPIVGIVAGIVYLFRNKIGPGLGLIATGIVLIGIYVALFTP